MMIQTGLSHKGHGKHHQIVQKSTKGSSMGNKIKMEHLQNIKLFETSTEAGNLQSYDKQSRLETTSL